MNDSNARRASEPALMWDLLDLADALGWRRSLDFVDVWGRIQQREREAMSKRGTRITQRMGSQRLAAIRMTIKVHERRCTVLKYVQEFTSGEVRVPAFLAPEVLRVINDLAFRYRLTRPFWGRSRGGGYLVFTLVE